MGVAGRGLGGRGGIPAQQQGQKVQAARPGAAAAGDGLLLLNGRIGTVDQGAGGAVLFDGGQDGVEHVLHLLFRDPPPRRFGDALEGVFIQQTANGIHTFYAPFQDSIKIPQF